MHLNVQHLIPKYDEIKYILTSKNYDKIDVLGLCETYLRESIVDFNLDIPGYSYLRKDRKHKKGGGLLVYIANHVNFKNRQEFKSETVESIWIDFFFFQKNAKPFFVCFVYRPPNSKQNWITSFEAQLQRFEPLHTEIHFLGDFNFKVFAEKICLNVRHGQNLS